MRIILILFLGVFLLHARMSAQTGQLRILLKQKTKEDDRPLSNADVTVKVDSLKFELRTDTTGYLPRINVPVGQHVVTVSSKECDSRRLTGVMVAEGKTVYQVLSFTCKAYLDSLSKRERKKLGYR